jgi:uncharacterized membrane protein YqjE
MRRALSRFGLLFFSPVSLVTFACCIWAVWAVYHLLGWNEATTIISGTLPPGMNREEAWNKAVVYMLVYFAGTLLAPALGIAAVVTFIWNLLRSRTSQLVHHRSAELLNPRR